MEKQHTKLPSHNFWGGGWWIRHTACKARAAAETMPLGKFIVFAILRNHSLQDQHQESCTLLSITITATFRVGHCLHYCLCSPWEQILPYPYFFVSPVPNSCSQMLCLIRYSEYSALIYQAGWVNESLPFQLPCQLSPLERGWSEADFKFSLVQHSL